MVNEKRLIDANILKTLFDVRYDTAFIQERTRENKEQWNGYCNGINWGRNTIADAPTVDAVEVVRCCNCEYHDHDGAIGHCNRWDKWTKMSDFCSHGERKEKRE